jgi:hypothetical protein
MEVFAISENHPSERLEASNTGQVNFTNLKRTDIACLQLCNRETGTIQEGRPENVAGLFVDATASGTRIKLPENWSTALWDSTSWAGPTGLGIFAVSKSANWKNPLPHLDGRINPGPTSLPLIVASALEINLSAQFYDLDQAIYDCFAPRLRNHATFARHLIYLYAPFNFQFLQQYLICFVRNTSS